MRTVRYDVERVFAGQAENQKFISYLKIDNDYDAKVVVMLHEIGRMGARVAELACIRRLATIRLIAATLLIVFQAAEGANFYVTPNGDDGHAGTKSEPFATLLRARDAVRKLKEAGPLATPVTVFVSGGNYHFTASLELNAQDSGTQSAPIIWQADGNEVVRLSGGPTLSADAFGPVADKDVRQRLDEAARDKVLQADLKAIGIGNLGNYPALFRGVPAVPELFINGQRLTLARWPNEGWATIEKIVDSGSMGLAGGQPKRSGVFTYSGQRPSRWNVETGVWLRGYWCYDWYEEAIQVGAVDPKLRQITLSRPCHYSLKQGNPSPRRYYALNLLEELDRPGEYYIDHATSRLYVWPPAGLAKSQIVLSTLNAPLVVLHNASDLVFRGFLVEAGLGDGIEVSGGHGVQIESCEIRNTRKLGIRVTGGTGHRVLNCNIHDTGTGGVVLEGGDRKTLTPAGHEAINNHIWRFSRHQLTYASGITLAGVGNRADHNLIHEAPHMAVSIRGNDHLFEFNIVHDVCTASDDAGALYKGRNPSCRGNMIRNNFWRDIGSPMGHGTAAIYFDDGDGGDKVIGNIFLRCGYPGRGSFGTIFSHGGHDLMAENNIFIECPRAFGSAPWNDQRWQEAVAGGGGCLWQKRLLEEVDITKPPYTTHYPELVGFMDPRPGQVRVNRAKNNVLVRCDQARSGNWQYAEAQIWVTNTDPGFVAVANGNYQLRSDAEVFQRLPDFRPIPFNKMGPRP